MFNYRGIIALDLDGTLLNSDKQLSAVNKSTLQQASESGWAVVPTTGRFYNGMPQFIRELPFVRYAITINGAEVADLNTEKVIYKAEIPYPKALEIMTFLDNYPLIYDCYQGGGAFMTAAMKQQIDVMASSPHYRKMLRELRKDVPELKAFIADKKQDVQKIQFFTNKPELRLQLMKQLPERFDNILASSSVSDNVELNDIRANKGEALVALADYLGVPIANTVAFGDGLNDLSMLKAAGTGVAMANACEEAKKAADVITFSCDDDGVACGIKKICFNKQ